MGEEIVEFNGHRGKNGYLSTSYPAPLIDSHGRHYFTSDHFYYSQPFINDGVINKKGLIVVNSKSASKAKELCGDGVEVWDERKKLSVMAMSLLIKFNQNEKLKDKLLATKNAKIIFRGSDKFWGTGKNGDGENKLGLLLMRIRQVLQDTPARN